MYPFIPSVTVEGVRVIDLRSFSGCLWQPSEADSSTDFGSVRNLKAVQVNNPYSLHVAKGLTALPACLNFIELTYL